MAGAGGAEHVIAVLAEALSASHDVVIAHRKHDAFEKALPAASGCDLRRVRFLRLRDETPEREISSDCDLFVTFLHQAPPLSVAPQSALVVLFPTYRPPQIDREWKKKLDSYAIKLSISNFTRAWTWKRWGVESEILYPPVALPRDAVAAKESFILSVGRFATGGHTKKQIEMLETFQILRRQIPTWNYTLVGGLNETLHDRLYFEATRLLANANGATVMANAERAEIVDLYRRASIFWHAAGLGEDIEKCPENAEHFGMATVEAMSHGCVPLVINCGGQPEIVEHGVSGFLWETLDQLRQLTMTLAQDRALLEKMSAAAKVRAELFSRENCIRRFVELAGIEHG